MLDAFTTTDYCILYWQVDPGKLKVDHDIFLYWIISCLDGDAQPNKLRNEQLNMTIKGMTGPHT